MQYTLESWKEEVLESFSDARFDDDKYDPAIAVAYFMGRDCVVSTFDGATGAVVWCTE